jgi:hypothetical protein
VRDNAQGQEVEGLAEGDVPPSEGEAETTDSDTDTDRDAKDEFWDSDSYKPQLNKMVTRLQTQLREEPMPFPAEDAPSVEDSEEEEGSEEDSNYEQSE